MQERKRKRPVQVIYKEREKNKMMMKGSREGSKRHERDRGEGENLNSNDWLFGRRECWDVILLLFCLREEEIQSHVLISTFVVLERTSHNYN